MSFAWMSNPQYLAQVGHYLGGASLLLTTGLFSLAAGAGWRPVILTLAVGVFAASVKEFVFDVASWGEGDSWADSLMDWAFYVFGGATGVSVVAWAFHVAGSAHS